MRLYYKSPILMLITTDMYSSCKDWRAIKTAALDFMLHMIDTVT